MDARIGDVLAKAARVLENETAPTATIDRVLADCVATKLSVTAELLRMRRRWEALVSRRDRSDDDAREGTRLVERLEDLGEERDELSMTIAVLRERRELATRHGLT